MDDLRQLAGQMQSGVRAATWSRAIWAINSVGQPGFCGDLPAEHTVSATPMVQQPGQAINAIGQLTHSDTKPFEIACI